MYCCRFDNQIVVKPLFFLQKKATMNNLHLIQFLAERPAINVEALIRELQIDKRNFYAILHNNRKIPAHKRGIFFRTMTKYGFIFDFEPTTQPILYYPI
jgi:putative heme iron utilization protein